MKTAKEEKLNILPTKLHLQAEIQSPPYRHTFVKTKQKKGILIMGYFIYEFV